MTAEAWAIGSLRDSLARTQALMMEAAELRGPRRTMRLKLAAGAACSGLKLLTRKDGLLESLHEQFRDIYIQRQVQQNEWETVRRLQNCLRDRALPELLARLDYQPPPTVEELFDPIKRNLSRVTQLSTRDPGLTFGVAKKEIGRLQVVVCKLSRSGIPERLLLAVNAALPVLAGSLLAEVVLPEAKDAVVALAPHAVEALHDLWSRADDLLHLLSMSAVVTSVGNAYISRAAIEIELAASQPERPDATEPVEPTHVVSVEPTGMVSAPGGQPSSVLPPLGNTDVSGQQAWISTFELLFPEVGTGDEEPEIGSVREATRRTLGIDRLDPPNNIRRVD